MREEIKYFADAMENTMQRHDAERGDNWKYVEFGFLECRLREEVGEYFKSGDINELLDIANFCMMIYYLSTKPQQ